MTEHLLDGLRVRIGTPIQVAKGIGHLWFPRISRFASGELIIKHSIAPDSGDLTLTGSGHHLSFDNGETWDFHYDVSEGPEVTVPQADGSLLGIVFRTYGALDGSLRNVRGHKVRLEDGGRRYVLEPWATSITGLPRDLARHDIKGQHGVLWRPELVVHGDAVDLGDEILATAYGTFAGDKKYTTIAIASSDAGLTWQFRSIVATPEDTGDAPEGPCEPTSTVLASGEVMCVLRGGGGIGNKLWRTYSNDNGHTWTPVEQLPAESVDPTVRRLSNDVVALSTGRPGVKLWLSADERARDWQEIDLIELHNAALPDPEHRIVPSQSADPWVRHTQDQTTGYTSMVEVSRNRLLLTYDRTPFGWEPVAPDSPERGGIYVVPVEVERQ